MSTRNPRLFNGRFVSNMAEDRIALLEAVFSTDKISNLTNMIFDFPPELVIRSMNEGKSIRQIVVDENIDWTQYVGALRDYQTLMTAFMYLSPRSINGDYVGLGKTAEVSALINYLKQQGELSRFCIAVEGSAFTQTACEIMKFTGLSVLMLPGETAKIERLVNKADWTKIDGIVCKHSVLKNDYFLKFLSNNISPTGANLVFNTLFIDESSVIKNTATKFCEYIKQILQITPRCHLMNATPFDKSIMDIYTQLDVCDINLLPPVSRIENRYSVWKQGSYWKTVNGRAQRFPKRDRVGYKNQDEFRDKLRYVYWGRSKKDVGKELPHNYRTYEVTPTKDQKIAIGNGFRYQEVLNCPSLIPEIGMPNDRKHVPKIDRLCNIIEEQYSDSKVMVYIWNPDAQAAIYDEMIKLGRKPVIVNGSTSDTEKWEYQTEFNRDGGKYDTLLTNARKSLNLYGADACILYSLESSSGLYTQICGRIDRNVDDRIRDFILLVYSDSPEYDYLTGKVKSRAEDSRALTIDAKGAIDYFLDDLQSQEEQ